MEKEKKDKDKEKEKEKDKDKEKERKKLPDLDKYWRVVKDDASDFTGWTYLLQYVDSEVKYIFKKKNIYSFYLVTWLFHYSQTLRRHARPTTHSCHTIPTAMAIGGSMRIMRNERESRQTAIR